MRIVIRFVAFVMLAGMLAACSGRTAVGNAISALNHSHPATTATAAATGASASASPSASAKSSPAVPTGPLGVLKVPAGATPWKDNTNAPMKLNAFVEAFYVQSGWTHEEGLYRQRGFVSGVIEGWINADDSQQQIAVIKFGSSNGALSQFDGLAGTLRDKQSPATVVNDSADGAVGSVDPTLDSLGNAQVDITAHVGDYVIDVHQFTPAKPDPAAAKALLLKQYNVLKGAS